MCVGVVSPIDGGNAVRQRGRARKGALRLGDALFRQCGGNPLWLRHFPRERGQPLFLPLCPSDISPSTGESSNHAENPSILAILQIPVQTSNLSLNALWCIESVLCGFVYSGT